MKAPSSLFAEPLAISESKLLFTVRPHLCQLPFCHKPLVLQNITGNITCCQLAKPPGSQCICCCAAPDHGIHRHTVPLLIVRTC